MDHTQWGVALSVDTGNSLVEFIAEHQANAKQFEARNQWALEESQLPGGVLRGRDNMPNCPVGWNGFGLELTIDPIVPLKYILSDKSGEYDEFHHKYVK